MEGGAKFLGTVDTNLLKLHVAILLTALSLAQSDDPKTTGGHNITYTVVNQNATSLPYMCLLCDCGRYGEFWSMNCSNLGLYRPPKDFPSDTLILDLSHNLFRFIGRTAFVGMTELRILELSNNQIRALSTTCFKSLVNLEYLGLSHNNMYLLQLALRPGIFHSLGKLETLLLDGNTDGRMRASFLLDATLSDLTSLKTLQLDGTFNMTFGTGYQNLTHLNSLILSGSRGRVNCNIKYVNRDAFRNVPYLTYLELKQCNIDDIHPDSFFPLRNLTELDLSLNKNLSFMKIGQAMKGLVGSDLKILRMNSIHDPNRAGSELLREDMVYLRDLKLIKWELDSNGLEFMDYSVFGMFPTTIEAITLRKNRLHFGFYLELIFDERNSNLKIFDAGDQEIAVRSEKRYDRLLHRKRHPRSPEPKTSTPPRPAVALQWLICSGSRSDIHLLNFSGIQNNITYMDLSNNFIPELKERGFFGLSNLLYLNLSGNYIEFCHSSAFVGLSSLMSLDLRNNLLGYELENDKKGLMFNHLHNLERLDLSQNRIYHLSKDAFTGLKKLQQLILSHNYIESFAVNLEKVVSLQLLDLSNNRLQQIPESVQDTLNARSESHNMSADLSRNQFLCDCETIPFITWLQDSGVEQMNRDEYYCSFSNGTTQYLNTTDLLLSRMKRECASKVPLIVGCTAGATFLSALIVSYVTYRKRWNLRYYYYMAKLKLDIRPNQREEAQIYQYDLFVSYADENRGFVINDMRQHLETTAGLQMNIRDRDFELGEVNAVNISKAVRKSKKTILLLSKSFLKNKWCDFEMNMARMESIHMKRNVLILVFFEEIPVNRLNLSLLDLLRSCPKIDYPHEMAVQPAFWDKLIQNIQDV